MKHRNNKHEFALQICFGLLAALYASYAVVVMPIIYGGWRWLIDLIFHKPILFCIFACSLVCTGACVLMTFAIRKGRKNLALSAYVMLCVDGVLRIISEWCPFDGMAEILVDFSLILNLAAAILLCFIIASKGKASKRSLVICSMVAFGMTIPWNSVVAYRIYNGPHFARVMEAFVFIYFGYCQLKGKLQWEEANGKRPIPVTDTSGQSLEQIVRWKELRDKGILTQEEFDTKKKEILERST